MTKHDTHSIHQNSVAAWKAFDPGTRARQVCEALAVALRPVTDREIATKLGSQDMNYARPAITGLIESGYVVEDGNTRCRVTGRTVRRVRLATAAERIAAGTRGTKPKHHGALWRTMCSDLGIDPVTADPAMIVRAIRGAADAGRRLRALADRSPMYSGEITVILDECITPNAALIGGE